ncbi:MAG: hypothetical protein AMXMBFR53_36700 [Gemmatimonadota bacterium]
MTYAAFLESKAQAGRAVGFDPTWVPDWLFGFQAMLTEWAVRRGRAAILADCGLGKGPMQLVWAENVVRHTNRPVLVPTPLAVSYQLVQEAEKFGIEAVRSSDGRVPTGARVVITNYERLDRFDPTSFAGVACDESSILKNFNGATKAVVTEFLRRMPYRLLSSATAAPNDYVELGTSSEALGELGYMDMLSRFFRNDNNNTEARRYFGKAAAWRFKGHAEEPFWRWVSSWARTVRKPSDLGFEDDGFILPPLTEREHVIEARTPQPGMLFDLPAVTLKEQRAERRRTIPERCETVAGLVDHSEQALVWCHLNDEADLLERLIPGAVQVAGSHPDDVKEERLLGFARGAIRVLVTKPTIGAWGLNLQNCAHVLTFPSHSYEQYYQSVRRCWRFGQERPVVVDIVATTGEKRVIENMRRKAEQADRMFSALLEHMKGVLEIRRDDPFYTHTPKVPAWL